MKRLAQRLPVIAFVAIIGLFLMACGGSGGGSSSSSTKAQGVYTGTTSTGETFETIVLPNDKVYALYGITSGNIFWVYGLLAGQGSSNNGSYTASVTDYYYTGADYSGSVTASYVVGSSLNGTYSESGQQETFTGSVSSGYNFNTPALLSSITGAWSGALMDGESATATLNSNGTFSGSSSLGCSFSGTISPDSSNDNFFDVSLTFGGSPCVLPNQTVSGVAVDYLLSDGVTTQLVAALTSGGSGTVFIANRANSSSSLASITVSPSAAVLSSAIGSGTLQMSASALLVNGNSSICTSPTWTTSDTTGSILTIGSSTGVVTPVGGGQATVTVKCNGTSSTAVPIEVITGTISSIIMNLSSTTVTPPGTVTATVVTSGGLTIPSQFISWSIPSGTTISTSGNSAVITFLNATAGTIATITATVTTNGGSTLTVTSPTIIII